VVGGKEKPIEGGSCKICKRDFDQGGRQKGSTIISYQHTCTEALLHVITIANELNMSMKHKKIDSRLL
jgi:hypothetical protein